MNTEMFVLFRLLIGLLYNNKLYRKSRKNETLFNAFVYKLKQQN